MTGRADLKLVVPAATQAEAGQRSSGIRARSERLDPDALFRRHSGYVATIAHRLLGHDDEVDDTVQDVFVIAVRGVSRIRNPDAVRAWLASVTVRVARRRLKIRRARLMLGIAAPTDYEHVASESATPEQRALVARVYRLLDGLPVNERLAWSLHTVEGETLVSVARLCGCSLATTKRRIQRVATALREAFDV